MNGIPILIFLLTGLTGLTGFFLVPHFPEENEEGQSDFVGKIFIGKQSCSDKNSLARQIGT